MYFQCFVYVSYFFYCILNKVCMGVWVQSSVRVMDIDVVRGVGIDVVGNHSILVIFF